MRKFDYFLYDNYDEKDVPCDEEDPRMILNQSIDNILSEIVETVPGMCRYDFLCTRYTQPLVDKLVYMGLLRMDNQSVLLDAPVIVNEDFGYLSCYFFQAVSRMADSIIRRTHTYYHLANQLNNRFLPEVNLYHILCGSILDGSFFDYLSRENIVSTSRIHNSGLNYLIIAYEKTTDLDSFSRKLLCSYNRFTDGTRSLQSFGDADGNRIDAFRFMCQKRLGKVPDNLIRVEKLWDLIGEDNIKAALLSEMQSFVETGCCDENCYQLLSEFRYIEENKIKVPIYRKESASIIQALEELTEECISDEMKTVLNQSEITSWLCCGKQGVSGKEISNELYHIIFGQLNEILVSRGFVCKPESFIGEGRYLKSIEIM